VPWNSSLIRRSNVTRRGSSFVSPVASAIPHPSGRCYVSDFQTRISAERQLQVTAFGKYGMILMHLNSEAVKACSPVVEVETSLLDDESNEMSRVAHKSSGRFGGLRLLGRNQVDGIKISF
jgi:hypothetical protein